jgi:hypothetical protein
MVTITSAINSASFFLALVANNLIFISSYVFICTTAPYLPTGPGAPLHQKYPHNLGLKAAGLPRRKRLAMTCRKCHGFHVFNFATTLMTVLTCLRLAFACSFLVYSQTSLTQNGTFLWLSLRLWIKNMAQISKQ